MLFLLHFFGFFHNFSYFFAFFRNFSHFFRFFPHFFHIFSNFSHFSNLFAFHRNFHISGPPQHRHPSRNFTHRNPHLPQRPRNREIPVDHDKTYFLPSKQVFLQFNKQPGSHLVRPALAERSKTFDARSLRKTRFLPSSAQIDNDAHKKFQPKFNEIKFNQVLPFAGKFNKHYFFERQLEKQQQLDLQHFFKKKHKIKRKKVRFQHFFEQRDQPGGRFVRQESE